MRNLHVVNLSATFVSTLETCDESLMRRKVRAELPILPVAASSLEPSPHH